MERVTFLPEPLEKKEEKLLLERATKSDQEAKNILVERNLRLVSYVANKLYSSDLIFDDLMSIGAIGLIKAVNTFHLEKKCNFSTYATRCVENEILKYICVNNRRKYYEISYDYTYNNDNDTHNSGNKYNKYLNTHLKTEHDICNRLENKEKFKILNEAIDTLSDREKLIVQMRHGINCQKIPAKEITQKLGISKALYFNLQKRSYMKLKKYLEKNGICSAF